MTDIKSHSLRPIANNPAKVSKTNANPLFLREEVVRQGIEMLFYSLLGGVGSNPTAAR